MNLDKVRARLASMNTGQNQKKHIWKPAPGDTVIRIVPYIHNPDFPFMELYFHYEVTKRSVLSPIINEDPDPVEEFAAQLKSTGDPNDYSLARKISPTMRTYVPVLVRGKEDEGPKFWGFGKTTYEELLKLIDDPDWGDIASLRDGRDIVVSYEKGQGESYAKTTIRPKPKATVATDDKNVLELLANMPKVEDIWPVATYSELKSALERYINNIAGDDDSNDGDAKPVNEKSSTPPPPSTGYTNKETLDDEFADLLDSKPSAKKTETPTNKSQIKETVNIDEAFDEMFK